MNTVDIKPNNWFVYIVGCADNTLYTGITTELKRRIKEHNQPGVGAKYTRARQPVKLLYQEEVSGHSVALKREAEIKKLSRRQKLLLIKG